MFDYFSTPITLRLVFGIPRKVGVSEWVCRLLAYLVGVWFQRGAAVRAPALNEGIGGEGVILEFYR